MSETNDCEYCSHALYAGTKCSSCGRVTEQPAQQALDKMAENARELGLDYEQPTYTFKPPSEPVFAFTEMKPNHNITFHNQDSKQVGELNFNGPEMVFTGDADESAKLFFDFIARSFKTRLDQERNATLNEIAKWLEDEKDAPYWAELVRARSNT